MGRLSVSVFLSILIAAENAFAAATSPGGARVVVQDPFRRKDQNGTILRDDQIPDEITSEHWAYQEVADLQQRYAAGKKLSEGKCSKTELLESFVASLVNVVDEFKKHGATNIRRDDMESIRALIIAMEDELFVQTSYLTIRVTLERLLALVEPPVPLFKYKLGVNGFARGEVADNFNILDLNYIPGHGQGRAVYRLQPFAYWHPNDYFDIQALGQSYGFTGQNHSTKATLYEGFVEARIPNRDLPGVNWASLKAGRQEFVYGSGFILGSDTFFDGLSFDATRLRMQPRSTITLDLLSGNYAAPFSGGINGNLTGTYLTYGPSDDNSVEGYWFRDRGYEERQSGEYLDTLGLRTTSSVGIYALEFEGALQTGRSFNPDTGRLDTIHAAGGHVDLTGQFKLLGYDQAVFMSIAAGTGDNADANKEFRNSNNDSSLMGDMHVVGDLSGVDVNDHHASGLQIYTAGWGIELTRKLDLSVTGRKFVAINVENGFSRRIGMETDATMTYSPNKDYTLIVGYDHFFTGTFFRQASGSRRDVDYAFVMLAFNYDRTRRKR